jgi:tRNA A-37 threonylcarbamoyl transferase component Bud32
MTRITPPERWREIEEVLDRALDLSTGERAAFLESACGADVALRDEVERLLCANDRAGDFLEEPLLHIRSLIPDAMPIPPALSAPGTTIAGRYALARELGRGGTATVYLARDTKHNRPVAIKVLDTELARWVGAGRFLREIEITANLQHPHILPLHDSGEFDGLVYYVMPYVAGETLRDRLHRERPLPIADAISLARDIAGALDYAHRRGVVHRDIKPGNILIEDGQAIVADFGIARAISTSAADGVGPPAAATRPGQMLGTPAYMSPEQVSGDHELSAPSDVYSLGCVVYEMLAGDPPFSGADARAVMTRHLQETAPPLRARRPEVPEYAARAVAKAMAKDPADRFPSASDFADALGGADTSGATPLAAGSHVSRWRRIALGGGVTAATIALAGIALLAPNDRPPVAATAATIAVFPLSPPVADTVLTRLGRELVVTLSASLDGVGGIRTADALTVLANARVTDDSPRLTDAVALARRLGARSVVYGSVMRVGSRARIDVALHSASTTDLLARVTVTAPADDMAALTDSTAWGILRQLWQTTDPPTPSLAAITTPSMPALRAFLDGERLIVGGRWRAAADAFQLATTIDSTFWLAYWRYAFARDFNVLPVDSTVRRKYRAHRAEFPERDRLLIEAAMADSASEYYRRVKIITQRFPDYWPAWWALSEYLAHTGPLLGTTDTDLRAALERTLALNPRMVSVLDHLSWVSLWQRDTALSARMIRELTALRYDSIGKAESGYDVLALDRYYAELARSGGVVRDSTLVEPIFRMIGSLTGPLDPHRFALGSAQYGFPLAQTRLTHEVLSRQALSKASGAWRLGLAVAYAQRGAWDSSLVTMTQIVAASPDPIWVLYRYRLAAVGAWLGAVDPRIAATYRDAMTQVGDGLPPASRAEVAWLDGLLAAARGDMDALTSARASVTMADTIAGSFLARSLSAFALAASGNRARAADSLVALEHHRAEFGWSRYRSDAHPFLTGVNRLAAARWLVERGKFAAAARLLTWHQAVLFPLQDTREANIIMEPLAYLEQARVAEALGRRDQARAYYQRFLWRYDAPPPPHRSFVDDARSALAKLGK